MSAPLADLFPGFAARTVETGAGEQGGAGIFLRTGGEGPPLLLIHGYPQTHVMWHRVAPALAERFTLVIPDLRGYGQSSVPASDADHYAYSKRAMAGDFVEVMAALGHDRFHVAGHDRGGRVAYRLALDHPDRVQKIAVLDIVPTYAMWQGFDIDFAMKVYHWIFLAQPNPLPEMLISRAPVEYLDYTIASWTKAKSLAAFDDRALVHYRAFFSQPERIHACCEDYRAGQDYDYRADTVDAEAGNRIAAPLLALWGAAGIPSETESPLETWRAWAGDVTGMAVDSGHFVCEENPDATAAALLDFFGG
ncbi:alpha/beta hydrolase [Microbaculum marinum]|uniref:Alpha/beta hydrolase n=1 Tax=Microbaculum marinum TaxID=1764581 RepID=A0AAW9RQ49_9HYPH